MSDFDRISQLLGQLGARVRLAARLEYGLWCGAFLLLAIALAVGLAQLGWTGGAVGALGAALVLGVVVWVWLVNRSTLALRGKQLREQARLVEELAPELGSAPSSAVDLAEQLRGDVTFSRELAEAHLARTWEHLGSVELERRLAQERRPHRRIAAFALGLAAVISLVAVAAMEKGRTRLATLILEPGAARLSDVPLAGDIRITYRYPAYTGLPPRVVEGGDGSISAVAGTEVTLEAQADEEPRQASLKLQDLTGQAQREIPMHIDGRKLSAKLSVLHDGRYHFALVTADGDRLEDRNQHAIRAVLDTYPQVNMDEPTEDVELKDDQEVSVLWRSTDDFGIPEVNLVIEPDGGTKEDAIKISLSKPAQADKRLEGRYRLRVSELGLEPGKGARFYVEAFDNDTIGGPKRGVSSPRRLVIFSAQANHEKLLARQQEAMDALVDWLGADLVAPFPRGGGPNVQESLAVQKGLVEQMYKVSTNLVMLVADLREDQLTKPGIIAAFSNVLENVNQARTGRGNWVERASRGTTAAYAALSRQQANDIAQLEKDIIYLDDLLAVQRIDELKSTAKDLLAAQRNLQEMLAKYKETQDPALRAELEAQIREMRQKMLDLLARMASIKEKLPGEYRNMESASMLQMEDQMQRLEKMLQEGNLDEAAAELEQLANMIENMVDSINEAEEEYGGERYAEMRQQLQEFAQQFKELESEQKALAERTDKMLSDYRRKSIERAGKNLDNFVEQARKETAEALKDLDKVAQQEGVYGIQRDLQQARQRLMDLDALLEHKDFAEARRIVQDSLQHQQTMDRQLRSQANRFRGAVPEFERAADANAEALEHTQKVEEMLDKLFPDPSEVMTPEQMAQMERMAQKQQNLEQRAQELGQKMDDMSGEMPLFGGEPRGNLQQAQQEMGQAANEMGRGSLPRAAGHEQRAVEQLGKLREALEQAAQGSGGRGLPLPLGGQGSRGEREGRGSNNSNRDVDIQSNPNKSGQELREHLREASKQKAPERYQEAVKRYYRELIR